MFFYYVTSRSLIVCDQADRAATSQVVTGATVRLIKSENLPEVFALYDHVALPSLPTRAGSL